MGIEEKRLLRKRQKALRDGISPQLRREYSRSIADKALALVEGLAARTVFVYLSYGSEPETHALIRELLNRGIRVGVPVCDTKTHTMDAVTLNGWEELVPGAYGILEPQGGGVIPPGEIDLILVPGLAFDNEGYRLGYGGGYYDRYLQNFHGVSAGLAFSACCAEALPRDAFDLPVSHVLTEEGGNHAFPR
ncbi:MAG: 5-formyltetrahydrofolate cyclo-ligase [Clostridia bacterium]|nr:5-formyltetrahydrofolate cyclo-ligase [Clostridia bacterium]